MAQQKTRTLDNKMKFLQELMEAQSAYGIAVSHDRTSGRFDDIKLVDFNTNDVLDGQRSHAHDMMDKLVQVAKRNNMWGSIESILKRNSRQTEMLGDEFDDTTQFVTTKYGPFTPEEIGQLADHLEAV